jgi:GNAT superfamily N-acetyltransferase
VIRQLTEADRESAIVLIRQFFEHHSRCVSTPRIVADEEALKTWGQWLQNPVFGCIEEGRLLGLIRFREDHGTYWIEDLIVHEEKRGSGIGGRILKWAEEWAKSRGADALYLDVVPANLEALDFFLSQGYDLLNTIELRKSFGRTPPRAEISFLGRRFRLHSWPADKPLPGDKI